MNNKRILYILVIVTVVFIIGNCLYYTYSPNQLSFAPSKISLIDEQTHVTKFLDRDQPLGKEVLKKMYGPYEDFILQNPSVDLSTPSSAEFTLPHVGLNNKAYILRENPVLRYKLWRNASPDIILLGSSMFFCDFNREAFYSKYPNLRLLDFTTGNNTPYIANYFLQYADSLGLKLKPNSIVIYGMNKNEMLGDYRGVHTHDYLKKVLHGVVDKKNASEQISNLLKISNLKYDLLNFLNGEYDHFFRTTNLYRKVVDREYTKDTATFRKFILANVPHEKSNTEHFDEERIGQVKELADLLKNNNCKLIILKLPQSIYEDYMTPIDTSSSFDIEVKKLLFGNVRFVDASGENFAYVNELDYLWPGNLFDPEHLNLEGSRKFTNSIINNVLDTLIKIR